MAALAASIVAAKRLKEKVQQRHVIGETIEVEEKKLSFTFLTRHHTISYSECLDPELHSERKFIQNYIWFGQLNALITTSKLFNNLIICCIIGAAVLVGIQQYDDGLVAVEILDTIILYIFTVEVIFKVLAQGVAPWQYFMGPEFAWNNFDFIIVVLCYLPLGGDASSARLLRLFRLMRVAKIVRKIPQLAKIVMGLVGGLKSIVYIMILLFLVFYLYAIAGIIFFASNDPWHYGDLFTALVTLFRCSTMEDWTEIMYINIFGCDAYPNIYALTLNTTTIHGNLLDSKFYCTDPSKAPLISVVFHISFIIVSGLVMMSLFVGAITMAMTEHMSDMSVETEENQRQKRIEKNQCFIKEIAQQNQENEGSPVEDNDKEENHAEFQAPVAGRYLGQQRKSSFFSESRRRSSSFSLDPLDMTNHRKQQRAADLMFKAWEGMDMHETVDTAGEYKNPFRNYYAKLSWLCRRITKHSGFQNFIVLVILLAGVLVGLQTYSDTFTDAQNSVIETIDAAILWVFTSEVIIKVVAEEFQPWLYCTDPWNLFDFFIVMASQPYAEGSSEIITMFRLLRLLRVLKLVKALPQLQVIVTALIMGLNSIGFIAIIILIFFYFFAIIGMLLFDSNDPWHFGNLHMSMFTLFRCATLEDWTDVMYINMYGCDQYGYDEWPEMCTDPTKSWWISVLYFFTFTIIGALVLFSLFIGVVTTSMEEATHDMTEIKETKDKVDKVQESYGLPSKCISLYKEVFMLFDLDGSNTIELEELAFGLELIKKKPPKEKLNELYSQVDSDGNGTIDFSEFLEFMAILHQRAQSLRKDKGRGVKVSTKKILLEPSFIESARSTGRRSARANLMEETSECRSSSINSKKIFPINYDIDAPTNILEVRESSQALDSGRSSAGRSVGASRKYTCGKGQQQAGEPSQEHR
mmetsp:Transcript_35695/g.47076  ORF Transcript_35695/g.47076 Transcript_35695/m.47076 type:complete len:920 (-) Transcript_35695:400-3159(-)